MTMHVYVFMYVCTYVCMYACMCVGLYVCVCVCMCVCLYETVCMCVWLYVCMNVCMYVCAYVCMHVFVCMYVCVYIGLFVSMCMCVCMYVSIHACHFSACMYGCPYVCMYVCMYVCVYVCMYVCMRPSVCQDVCSLSLLLSRYVAGCICICPCIPVLMYAWHPDCIDAPYVCMYVCRDGACIRVSIIHCNIHMSFEYAPWYPHSSDLAAPRKCSPSCGGIDNEPARGHRLIFGYRDWGPANHLLPSFAYAQDQPTISRGEDRYCCGAKDFSLAQYQ